jgi:hypothetical protein
MGSIGPSGQECHKGPMLCNMHRAEDFATAATPLLNIAKQNIPANEIFSSVRAGFWHATYL